MEDSESFDFWDDSCEYDSEGFEEYSESDSWTRKTESAKSTWEREAFVYPPLNLDGPVFRLLRLHKGTGPQISCHLFETWLDGLDRHISYESLSYTWGKADVIKRIEVNGKRLDITPNLYSALYHLRFPDRDRVLWADAICIDQSNTEEREHQVGHMSKIYSQADGVIFWLDESTPETDGVFDALVQLRQESEKLGCQYWQYDDARWASIWASNRAEMGESEKLYQGMRSLLGRRWFRRVWILQEVANARAALVCCGRKSIQARFFALAPRLIGIKVDRHCQAVLDIMPGPSRDGSWWSQDRKLYTLVKKFGAGCEASDPRDKIYAMLGLCTDAQDSDILRPDYKKNEEDLIRDAFQFFYFCKPSSSMLWHVRAMDDFIMQIVDLNTVALFELVSSSNTMSLHKLLDRKDLRIPEEVVVLALANIHRAEEIITLLVQRRRPDIRITSNVLAAGVTTTPQAPSREAFQLLLWDNILEADMLPEMLQAAKRRWTLQAGGASIAGAVLLFLLHLRDHGVPEPFTQSDLVLEKVNSILSGSQYMVREELLFPVSENGECECLERLFNMLFELDRHAHSVTIAGYPAQRVHVPASGRCARHDPTGIRLRRSRIRELLCLAAYSGDARLVEKLVVGGADIESVWLGQGPLGWAAEGGHEAATAVLLDHDALTGVRSHRGRTPLTPFGIVLEMSHIALVRLFLETGRVDLGMRHCRHATPAFCATENGHSNILRLLLQTQKVDPNHRDPSGCTLLLIAINKSLPNLVKVLLEFPDVDLNIPNNKDHTPLSMAVAGGETEIFRLLLEDRRSQVQRSGEIGRSMLLDSESKSPVFAAIDAGHMPIIKLLHDIKKVDMNQLNPKFGHTPLIYAIVRKRDKIAKALLHDLSVDPNKPSHDGMPPLVWAINESGQDVVKLLLDTAQVDPNNPGLDGMPPLVWAIRKRRRDIVKLLLDTAQVDPNKPSRDGMPPLAWAIREGMQDVVKLLLDTAQIDPNNPGLDGMPPLVWAIKKRKQDIVKLLLDTGRVDPNKQSYDGMPPILWGIKENLLDIVTLLLYNDKVKLNQAYSDWGTPLTYSSKEQRMDIVLLLVKCPRVDLKIRFKGRTALSYVMDWPNTPQSFGLKCRIMQYSMKCSITQYRRFNYNLSRPKFCEPGAGG